MSRPDSHSSTDCLEEETVPKDDLKEDLHRVTDDLGHAPGPDEYAEHGSYSVEAVHTRFESWSQAIAAVAGKVTATPDFDNLSLNSEATTPRPRDDDPSAEEIYADIQRVAGELDHTPTCDEYTTHGDYLRPTIRRVCGTWSQAVSNAGFSPRNSRRHTDELLADLTRVADKLGHPPSIIEHRKYGDYSPSVLQTRFGGWGDALKAAGLETSDRGQATREIPDDVLREDIRRVADELGYHPTYTDYDKHGKYSPGTCRRAFGSWDAALREAGFEPRQ